jgi:hypothetical protein
LAASCGVNRVLAITQWTRGGLYYSSGASDSHNVGRNNVVSRLGDQTVEVIKAYTLQGRKLTIHDDSGDHDDAGIIKKQKHKQHKKEKSSNGFLRKTAEENWVYQRYASRFALID